MELSETIKSTSDYIEGMKKKLRHKYSKKLFQNAVDISVEINECVGKMTFCQNEFRRVIKRQSAAIKQGREEGYTTAVQESMLENAAVGYLLVKEALYALSTLRNYDSLESAFDMLEYASLTMQGKKETVIAKLKKLGKHRAEYNYIFSEEAFGEKFAIVDNIKSDLINFGDIDMSLANIGENRKKEAVRSRTLSVDDDFVEKKDAPAMKYSDSTYGQLKDALADIPDDDININTNDLDQMAKQNPNAKKF